MRPRTLTWVVALDGGTTNTRARLLNQGVVVATARRAVGVRDTVRDSSNRPLFTAVREVIREVIATGGGVRPDAIVAAGMLTADVGLATVPHVVAPAGLEALAQGAVSCDIPEVSDRPILLIPGVRTPPSERVDSLGWAEADVMRGEECETFGALQTLGLTGPLAFVWPGSHTKLVAVDADGRITRSFTTLAGEMTSALARHTLLAASLPDELPESPDPQAYATGARLVSEHGLGRAAFLVRVAALTGSLGPAERGAFWVGASIADDARVLARHAILADPIPVWVGGRSPLREHYTEVLRRRHRGVVTALDPKVADEASALGALAVARVHSG